MLEKLSNAFGPSGYEFEVKDIITNFMQKYCDEIIIDKIGNIICHKNGYSVNNKSIMLTSHMDEVGFIINYITDDGYLKFKSVGGIDYKILVSKKVIIGKNKICGVIGNMPVHLKKNNNENINIEDLYIDIGAKNKDDALNYVQIGDYACFDSKFTKFGDDLIKGKALDDRIGCYILMEIAKKQLDLDIYFCFLVQEEIGCRGARHIRQLLDVDSAIIVEGTMCSDVPGTIESQFSTNLGMGPALSIRDNGAYSDRKLTKFIIDIANDNNIKWQYKRTTAGGNDSSVIQITDKGTKVASISVPCRYIHSQSSVASINDIESTIKLLEHCIKGMVKKSAD